MNRRTFIGTVCAAVASLASGRAFGRGKTPTTALPRPDAKAGRWVVIGGGYFFIDCPVGPNETIARQIANDASGGKPLLIPNKFA